MEDTRVEPWKYRSVGHRRINKVLFQFNIPLDKRILEFQVVAFVNGTVVSRATFWDSTHDFFQAAEEMYSYLMEKEDKLLPSFYDYESYLEGVMPL